MIRCDVMSICNPMTLDNNTQKNVIQTIMLNTDVRITRMVTSRTIGY